MANGNSSGARAQLIEDLARKQHGLLGRAQLRAAGMSSSAIGRRLDAGKWEKLHPTVYRIRGVPDSWPQRVMAACLWSETGVASHATAAHLWGLVGRRPRQIEITVHYSSGSNCSGIRVHRTRVLPDGDIYRRDGIPMTHVPRTVIDMAPRLDEKHLDQLLSDALRTTYMRLDWLEKRLRALEQGRQKLDLLRELVRRRDPSEAAKEQSWLESAVRDLLRRHDLHPSKQKVMSTTNQYIGTVDFAFPGARVVLEAQSYRWHDTSWQFSNDCLKFRRLAGMGWLVVPVTKKMLDDDPDAVIADIRGAIASRR